MTDFPEFLPPGLSNLGISSSDQTNEDRQALGQDQFFDLMVAQLTNQDPLNPLESNEFIAQVAQFSTVNGIKQIQESIGDLATSFQSGQALQASTMVGRDVLVPGARGVLHPGATLSGAIDVASATGDLSISVLAPSGEVVRQLELGPQPAGLARFSWDGLDDAGEPAPPGHYVIQATANIDDQAQAVPTLMTARVESVTLTNQPGGLTLNLESLGPVSINDIRQLL